MLASTQRYLPYLPYNATEVEDFLAFHPWRAAVEIGRPLLIVGNGPSSTHSPANRLPQDPLIFRLNLFMLEHEYTHGRRVDAVFWSVPSRVVHEALATCVENNLYDIGHFFTSINVAEAVVPFFQHQARRHAAVLRPCFSHHNILFHHPLIRPWITRRGPRPTQGFQALATALMLGFREIHLVGFDLYQDAGQRYGYDVPEYLRAVMPTHNLVPGYETGQHTLDHDLAFLETLLRCYPDAEVYCARPGTALAARLPLSPLRGIVAPAKPQQKTKTIHALLPARLYGASPAAPWGEAELLADGWVRGWAWDPRAPRERVPVEVVRDGRVVASGPAERWCADLSHSAVGDGAHAFLLPLPDSYGGEVVVRAGGIELLRTTARQPRRRLAPPSMSWPLLSGLSRPTAEPMHICLASPDVAGLVKNGGIGTATRWLALELAAAGHHVTVLYTNGTAPDQPARDRAEAAYRQNGVSLEFLEEALPLETLERHNERDVALSWLTYRWLAGRRFDVVVFPEWRGHAFFSVAAKRCGVAFATCSLVVQPHSPTLWHATNNCDRLDNRGTALRMIMERQALAHADAVVSPSQYMLNWLRDAGFTLPVLSVVHANAMPAVAAGAERLRPREIVFFGRLEYRKGLEQFCSAIDRLVAARQLPDSVAFLGKLSSVGSEHAANYIARRAADWPFPVSILSQLDSDEAIAWLRGGPRLAVIASVAENLPYTVAECLAAKVPFVARNVGGIPELVDPQDRSACLVDGTPDALCLMLERILRDGIAMPSPVCDPASTNAAWSPGLGGLHRRIQASAEPLPDAAALPFVTVCLVHHRRPHYLMQAVESLMAQTYSRFEVVLVDDGSEDGPSKRLLNDLDSPFRQRGWTILRRRNAYLGAARNLAASVARGDYLLFMDDDNVAFPNEIEAMVRAAQCSKADLVTCAMARFEGSTSPLDMPVSFELFLPLGDALAAVPHGNWFGDANALVRRETFETVGGFTEDHGIGHEDFELFLRMRLAGARIAVVPEPLYWYRTGSNSMLRSTNQAANLARGLRPLVQQAQPDWAELTLAAQSAFQASVLPAPAGDPNAPDQIIAAARHLIAAGRKDMAGSLLADFCMHPPQGLLQDTAAEVASLLTAATAPEQAAALSCLMAATGGTDLLIQMAGRKDPAEPAAAPPQGVPAESIPALLRMARLCRAQGQDRSALLCLIEALKGAEAAYLARRADVATAIASGAFGSGLHHYLRHGRSEGTPWIAFEDFRQTIGALSETIPDVAGLVPSELFAPQSAARAAPHDASRKFDR